LKCPINSDICKANIHPAELEPLIDVGPMPMTRDFYEKYRRIYNEKMRPQAGGASPSTDMFTPMKNAECFLPPKKQAGRRATYRRRKATRAKKTRSVKRKPGRSKTRRDHRRVSM
jgi:hypothetical protein